MFRTEAPGPRSGSSTRDLERVPPAQFLTRGVRAKLKLDFGTETGWEGTGRGVGLINKQKEPLRARTEFFSRRILLILEGWGTDGWRVRRKGLKKKSVGTPMAKSGLE